MAMKYALCCGILALQLVSGPAEAGEYEGRAILEGKHTSSVTLRTNAANPTHARRILESQFKIKRWTKTPTPVK